VKKKSKRAFKRAFQDKCLGTVKYFDIIKNGKEKECESLKYPDDRMLCNLYFQRTSEVCQKELNQLKELFCQKYNIR